MGNLVIATPIDSGSVAGGATSGNMTVANLLTMQPSQKTLWSNLGDIYAARDLGAATAVNLISLLFHRGTSAGTWRVRGATSQANLTASPGYDSETLRPSMPLWPAGSDLSGWPRRHARLWLGATPQTYRWWRIDVSDAASPDGSFEAGRLYLSNAWQPTQNRDYGDGFGTAEDAAVIESEGGASYPRGRPGRGFRDFALNYQSKAEMLGSFHRIQRLRGTSRDILVIDDPEEDVYAMEMMTYGILTGANPMSNNLFRLYRTQVSMRELI